MPFMGIFHGTPSVCGKQSINLSTALLIAVAIVMASLLYYGTNQSSNGDRATPDDEGLVHKESNQSSNGDMATPTDDGLIVNKEINQSSDGDSCYHLLNDGGFIPGNIWKPLGCSMHEYGPVESRLCMKAAANPTGEASRIFFIGNSRVRALYNMFIRQLGAKKVPSSSHKLTMPNFIYEVNDLQLEAHYLWRELLNEDIIIDLIERFKRQTPTLVVIGSVLHYFVNYQLTDPMAAKDYRAGITRLVEELDQLPATFPVLYMLPEAVIAKKARNKKIWHNELIEEYNQVAIEVFESTRVTVVRSVRLIGLLRGWDYQDGIHTTSATIKYFVQIVFNFFCNRYLAAPPSDTCCGPSEFRPSPAGPSFAIAIAACICVVCFVLLLVVLFSRQRRLLKTPRETAGYQEFDRAIEEKNTGSRPGTEARSSSPSTVQHC